MPSQRGVRTTRNSSLGHFAIPVAVMRAIKGSKRNVIALPNKLDHWFDQAVRSHDHPHPALFYGGAIGQPVMMPAT